MPVKVEKKTTEHKLKISVAHTGKHVTSETRTKLSDNATGMVQVYDIQTRKNAKISKQEFINNPERYVGVTSGYTTVFSLVEEKFVYISNEIFLANRHMYVGPKSGIYKNLEQFKSIIILARIALDSKIIF